MTYVYALTIITLICCMVSLFVFMIKHKERFDRTQAINTITTIIVLLIVTHGFFLKRPDFIDIAIMFTLMSTLSMLAILKYAKLNMLGLPVNKDSDDGDI